MSRDTGSSEAAMRVLLIVQRAERHDPHFIIRDVVLRVREQLGLSRAQAHRLTRQAIDLLGIPYDHDAIRRQRTLECIGDASSAYWMQRRVA